MEIRTDSAEGNSKSDRKHRLQLISTRSIKFHSKHRRNT